MNEIVRPSTLDEARARAQRIRSGMQVLAQWQQEVIAAYAARDWEAMGYGSWDAYLSGEYGEHRVRLPREQRREIVAAMTQAGMSTRAIGPAIGASHDTVHRDQSAVRNLTPVAVTGVDGKSYSRPAPAEDEVVVAELVDDPPHAEPPKTKRRPLPVAFTDAGRDLTRAAEKLARLTEDDRFAKNRETTHHQVPELLGALEHTARLVQAMNLPDTAATQEARRWWATSLRNISDALAGVATSIEKEI